MNALFVSIIIASLIFLAIQGEASQILTILTSSCDKAMSFSFSLAGIYCLWMGLMRIAEDCGLMNSLARLMSPVIRKLFGDLSPKSQSLVSLSIAANMLGLSNAATPISISAIEQMDREKPDVNPSYAMIMLFVINVTGITIIPMTVIGMRAQAGSVNPSDIFLPNLIVNVLNTAFSVVLTYLLCRKNKVKAHI